MFRAARLARIRRPAIGRFLRDKVPGLDSALPGNTYHRPSFLIGTSAGRYDGHTKRRRISGTGELGDGERGW
jgi:hypothetical protein